MPWSKLVCCILLACLPPAWAGTLSLAVSRSPLSLPLYVAQQQGYFAAEGLEVKMADCLGGHRCLGEMLDGRADAAAAGDVPIMFRSFDSADLRIVATFVTTWNDLKIVARKASGITTPRSLAGKTVGVVRSAASQYFLDSFLLLHGVDPATVQTVPMQPEEATVLLATGRVDAISIWEPFGYQAVQGLKGGAVVLSSDGVYNLSWSLVAHRRIAGARDADLAALLRALRRAQDYIRDQPQAAQTILRSRLQLDQGFVDWVWPHLHFRLSLDQALIKTLESQARWAIQEGHVQARRGPNYLAIVHDAPLRAVDPAAVGIAR